MLTRRTAIMVIALSAFLIMPPDPARSAWAQSGEHAVALVKSTSDQLVAIVNSKGLPTEKRRRLQQVIDTCVDVEGIARFSLGRFWHLATADKQTQYLVLFRELLVTKIASHFGEYEGVHVTMGLARVSEGTEVVVTMVERPENPPTQVDWVVSTTTGGPRIVDLLAEGTSLRVTQSADFTSYLAHHQYSVPNLIEAMRQMIAQR